MLVAELVEVDLHVVQQVLEVLDELHRRRRRAGDRRGGGGVAHVLLEKSGESGYHVRRIPWFEHAP